MKSKDDGFIAMVGAHRRLEDRLDEALADVIAAVNEHQAPGKVTLTLSIKPGGDGHLTHKAGIKCDIPRPGVPDAVFFADENGGVHRTDPKQRDIEDVFNVTRPNFQRQPKD